MNIEKRKEMVYKEVLASGALLWNEVQREVIEIEEKSKTAADPIQFILDERNKITFKGSEFGQRYIDFHYKELGDIEQMARTIADYYWLKIEWQIKKKEERHETIDVEEMLCSYHEEIDDFLKNYLLRQSLFDLSKKMQGNSSGLEIPQERKSDFLFNFYGNTKRAHDFLKALVNLRDSGIKIKPIDVLSAYQVNYGRPFVNTGDNPKANLQAIFDVIGNKKEYGLNIVNFAYSSLTKVFRDKKY